MTSFPMLSCQKLAGHVVDYACFAHISAQLDSRSGWKVVTGYYELQTQFFQSWKFAIWIRSNLLKNSSKTLNIHRSIRYKKLAATFIIKTRSYKRLHSHRSNYVQKSLAFLYCWQEKPVRWKSRNMELFHIRKLQCTEKWYSMSCNWGWSYRRTS